MSDDQFQDRFDRAFRQRIPKDVAHSFTEDQRAAIRTAFGGEKWDGHALDLRGVLPLFNWYFAFVAGPDKRRQRRLSFDDGPKPSLFGRVISAVTVVVVLALLAVLLFS